MLLESHDPCCELSRERLLIIELFSSFSLHAKLNISHCSLQLCEGTHAISGLTLLKSLMWLFPVPFTDSGLFPLPRRTGSQIFEGG